MTKKTISELPSIGTTQKSTALVAIEQDSVTSNAPVRPNPPNQRNYTTQAQIEADFPGLIITTDNLTFYMDDSFTLSLPIQIAAGISLEITSTLGNTLITYTGTGTVIQNETTGGTGRFKITDVDFIGDGTNDFIDIATIANESVTLSGLNLTNFNDLGTVDTTALFLFFSAVSDFKQGFKLKNYQLCDIETLLATQVTITTEPTFLSLTPDTTFGGRANLDAVTLADFVSGNTLLFLDPNSTGISTYQITNSLITGTGTDFYQQGMAIAVTGTAIGTSGVGFTNFTTALSHGLRVGKVIVNSGFGDALNNGTFVVVSVDTALTGTVYELEVLFDGTTDTGTMNATSLDNTDPLVLSTNNIASPDSMFIGESGLEIFGAEDTSSSLAQDAFEVVTNVAWTSTNLERFSDGVINTGQLVCNDPQVRKYNVVYSGTIEKSGGGSVNIGIVILKNGINIAFNPPHTVNIGKIQIVGSDIIELTDTDTLDIAVINYDATATTIDTSQLGLTVNKS